MTDYRLWKTGVSTKTFTPENFDRYREGNIQYMEVSPDRKYLFEVDYELIKRESERTGVKIWSYHLPFSNNEYNISHPDQAVRDYTIKLHCELIEKAAYIGAKIAVIHPSSEPIVEELRPEYMERSKKALKLLADHAEKHGITIAVENLPRTCLGRDTSDMTELLSADDRLRACFDVNHLLRDSHADMIKGIADKLVTLHISDYDFIDEVHAMPGKGYINWDELVTLLEKANYNGPFMYEVSFADIDKRDIKAPSPELCEFFQNHMNIKSFKGKK